MKAKEVKKPDKEKGGKTVAESIYEKALRLAKEHEQNYENIVIPLSAKVMDIFHSEGVDVENAKRVLSKLSSDINEISNRTRL